MLNLNECYLVKKNGEYLVACDDHSIKFSNYKYDGYPFNSFSIAQRVAKILGGMVMKHNRITGKLTGGWK